MKATRVIGTLFTIGVLLMLPTPESTDARQAKVTWLKTFSHGLEEARKSKKLLLVVAGANWCPDCRRLDSDILPNAEVQSFLSKRFACVHLESDTGEGKKLMEEQGTKVIPQIFVFATDAKLLGKAPAEHVTPESFMTLVTDLSKGKQK